MDIAAESRQPVIVDELLRYFVENGLSECFTACLLKCFDLIKPEAALELAWRNKLFDPVMPYVLRVVGDYQQRLERIEGRLNPQQEPVHQRTNCE